MAYSVCRGRFVQREPRAGEPASHATEARIVYTARTLFIGVRLHDAEPGRDDDAREAQANVLFRYTYRPGADLFVVFDEVRNILGEVPPLQSRRFQVKMTFYLVPGA